MATRLVTVWVHKDNFSQDEVLVAPDILGGNHLPAQALMEVVALKPSSGMQSTQEATQRTPKSSGGSSLHHAPNVAKDEIDDSDTQSSAPTLNGREVSLEVEPQSRFYFVAKPMPPDLRASQPMLQVSITTSIASTFGYRPSTQARISFADQRACSASHVELIFRDQYLSRSDMWRLVRSEMAGKTVHKGQKILFLGAVKAVINQIYLHGRTVSSAYFCENTIPVFRSQSARYVLFIQMSREMWDFDSEGTGEILFSRVIDGFLPKLFKKWVDLEVRHLVTIVLFGRLEYDRHASAALNRPDPDLSDRQSIETDQGTTYRDFYRVVTSEMASWQWTVILDKLKEDFLVFLRDTCLYEPGQQGLTAASIAFEQHPRINGQPTSSLRGNILEAINIASSQYSRDHIDRDLVRTGLSIIIITPGTGVFEVDRQLLDMTSTNLTNNGVGIDLVCLSNMPLHSVPLFKWLKKPSQVSPDRPAHSVEDDDDSTRLTQNDALENYPASLHSLEKAKIMMDVSRWAFAIPQWVDVSYWTSSRQQMRGNQNRSSGKAGCNSKSMYSKKFLPRVRMYELQMMGVMELGLANISIPYLSEGRRSHSDDPDRQPAMLERSRLKSFPSGNLATSPRTPLGSRLASSQRSGNRRPGLLSVQAQLQGDMYEWMDTYDEHLFSLQPKPKPRISRGSVMMAFDPKSHPCPDSRVWSRKRQGAADDRFEQDNLDVLNPKNDLDTGEPPAMGFERRSEKAAHSSSDSRISRAISFALRGLGPTAPRAVASTEINIENVEANRSASNLMPTGATGDSSKGQRHPVSYGSKNGRALSARSGSSEPVDTGYPNEPLTASSRPISIKNTEKHGHSFDKRQTDQITTMARPNKTQRVTGWQDTDLGAEEKPNTSSSDEMAESEARYTMASPEPDSSLSPWFKKVNPANPTRNYPKGPSWVGRWQHLYSRPPKASTVKWKSLCTPASLPLTTEDFPSMKDWQQRYEATGYVISQNHDHEQSDAPRTCDWLFREMIGLRLSHGYQVVVGRRLSRVVGPEAAASEKYFTSENFTADVVRVYMLMGNSIQRLSYTNGADVQVTCFVRKGPTAAQERMQCKQFKQYKPVMKTIFSNSYSRHSVELRGLTIEYPWKLADSHLAGHQDDLTDVFEQLRFWRARFVVIPFEPPASARRPTQSRSEDNEEEIHLLGIRELTKMWQKIRYTAPEERRFKPATGNRKDPNPLEIMFQTLNPSEVVATEIEKLLATDEAADVKQFQLLPDSEILERSTSSLSKIAQELQSERGVEIANRRWHIRQHDSCFKGDDFTNWLLSIFKDIESREEAVDFGNELMQHGLFQHVSKRHTFKDGNYFYKIAPEYRIVRPEWRHTWLPGGRRSDHSVPTVQPIESGSHMSLRSSQSQSGLNHPRPPEGRASEKATGEKRQVSVSLTKLMRIDVDHRSPKRSDRPEVVHLHYDRLHNPENCYHLELSWLNVTTKLIDDSIVTWATQLEKYGLRLVEVPFTEACSIPDYEPFREPYAISLELAPPSELVVGSGSNYSPNTSAVPPTAPLTDKLGFQKEILKKFRFVLDLEAASEFPPDVDVKYAWGKPTYRYSQYVHRSGTVLAQVTDEGEILLLFNTLYNNRSASVKDTGGIVDLMNSSRRRPGAASEILRMSTQNQTPHPSPYAGAKPDGSGSKGLSNTSGMWVNPSKLKDELEAFCHDAEKLRAFYHEVSERWALSGRKSGSTSSSALRPVPEYGLESSIPDLRLPASLVTASNVALKSLGAGLRKMTSPQQAARTQPSPEAAAADLSRRASVDMHF